MKHKIDNDFLLIELSWEECKELNFGFEGIIICDNCNTELDEEPYNYICCLNMVFCQECLDDWLKNAIHYDDVNELRYEANKFNFISGKLNYDYKARVVKSEGKNKIEIYDTRK